MSSQTNQSAQLIAGLLNTAAYTHSIAGEIDFQETHISYVILAGDFAYKIKKSIKTDFLDYSTLEKRKRCCDEELRLDRRYAPDLYIDVVPIVLDDRTIRVEADGEPIEYAVKMRRFPEGALLSERIDAGRLTTGEVLQLAEAVAKFHHNARVCGHEFATGWPDFIFENQQELCDQLGHFVDADAAKTLRVVQAWSKEYFHEHRDVFNKRVPDGFIRECHGDLHLQNVVNLDGRLTPFDGIEFNDRLRWIDVLSDAAFLAMDLAARDHLDLSRTFFNAYLEHTGDYESLKLIRWFLCYRAIVRALVASMRATHLKTTHPDTTDRQRARATRDCIRHIDLAYRYTLREEPTLWITHGVSGSGKTMFSETVVQRHDAIRLRSDLERKRIFDLAPTDRPTVELQQEMYGDAANRETYRRLQDLSIGILQAGYSVIVDATFLKREDRNLFRDKAKEQGVGFAILDCHADAQTLRQRIADRMSRNNDASDADLRVLEHQLATREPLSDQELASVIEIPDPAQLINR